LRNFFRFLAGEGRAVLVSSHQLNEVQEVADRVVILDRGRLIRSGSIAELTAGSDSVLVRTPQPDVLAQALASAGIGGKYESPTEGSPPGPPGLAPALRVHTNDPAHVGHVAFTAGVEIHELRLDRFDLEQLFFSLTQGQFAAPPPGQLPPTQPTVGGQA
jgi:ABC-2 type transport system ATP-binding protein